LDAQQVSITDTAIRDVIRHYTQESGVRNLERELATLCRRVARRTLQGRKKCYALQPRHIGELLGVRKFTFGVAEHQDRMGVVTGLAWTENGGALLSVETVVLPGTGKLTITGKLGDVMQESVQAAVSYVRSRAQILGLDRDFYQKADIHLHVPEGAIPKDGPSAGITIATAIVSALTRNPVRHDLAMTGEITLQGRVLPIGGLKEKLLAAQRGRYRKVLLPKGNEKDLVEVPREVCSGIVLVLVEHMDEVLAHALTQRLPGPEPATLSPPLEEISNQPLMAH
jgi:ATP-dependent Lon protease